MKSGEDRMMNFKRNLEREVIQHLTEHYAGKKYCDETLARVQHDISKITERHMKKLREECSDGTWAAN